MLLIDSVDDMQVSKEVASEFGELVADSETGELLHYAEKPETFVSLLHSLYL